MMFDRIKWIIVASLLLFGVVLNHLYGGAPLWERLFAWFLLGVGALFLAWRTTQGRSAIVFFKESRIELRKVFWPTRQETIQVTFMVLVVVTILAFVLWGMDSVLMWLMGWLTGQRS